MKNPIKLLLIYLDETDLWQESIPLYEAVVRRLNQVGISGATVHIGVMGFGSHHKVHRKRLFGIPDDRPVTVSVIDEESKIRSVLPEIKALVKGGLIILVDAEWVA
jgi:PII-like signaling protein